MKGGCYCGSLRCAMTIFMQDSQPFHVVADGMPPNR
jgi:hypothetical protein